MLKKMGNNNLVRLQKFMAECGVASRRKSEELIEMGKVKILLLSEVKKLPKKNVCIILC